ncbi:helicase and polymerase-containing protein TEBICHI [Selaginella moellendorffii]|uniref:helicase and polymerase-containing protein TEBICHI n=1 Tax=Selaginella moellendorffii TaxID=88036 RepID=UPI000D1C4F5B|nr:helicase and polymerase-containing protein TEBICHI [Selaginella moellendorffii]XP_024519316.1 helicase and polymerase-containing protein TEBICHI [Selaginella moellendorffii]|eukprot:XP_024519308.1 helicase and polymerase-containing protein TEBICHI [Selaginella moellendorffii]
MELEPDWGVYCQRFVELSYVDQAVATVGVTEASLMRMAHGAPMQGCKRSLKASEKASEANQNLRVYRRFFVALILSKLVQEVPLMDVCSTFKAARARCLYKAGLRTVEAVAEATIPEFTNALCDSSFKGHVDAGMDVCCNGAGRIVLDRAEETRIAAFSAFQALGATIPHSLSQSLYARVERPRWPRSPKQDESKADVHSTDKENRAVIMQENGNHGPNAFGALRKRRPRTRSCRCHIRSGNKVLIDFRTSEKFLL